MGGRGSGTWVRSEVREITGCRINIDVRKLKADMQSSVDTTGVITSYLESGHRSSLSYVVMGEYLVLGTKPALDTVVITNCINILDIVQTPCNFGGFRYWLICPICKLRKGIIYLNNKRLACRLCCNLAYSSQSDSKLERLIMRTKKAWHALGGTGRLGAPIPGKPKGMHWRTYWLGLQKAIQATRALNDEFDAVFPVLEIFRKETDDI